MSQENELSHRQEREQKKAAHAHSTPSKRLGSSHLTWGLVGAIIVIALAVFVWTFLILPARPPG